MEQASAGVQDAAAATMNDFGSCANSFAGDTAVLMADGSSKPIDQVTVGDTITNAIPGAFLGLPDQHHTVTAVHVTYTDHDYTDVTVNTEHGPATLTGTAHHLYWDATTRTWTDADQLHVGDQLQTSNGATVTITGLHDYTTTMVTYNLTIDTLHTYYVEASDVPILVHNAPPTACRITSAPDAPVIPSKTVFNNGKFRVDIENPAPGLPAAQIHIQFMGRGADPNKYYYNPANGTWITENGVVLAPRIANQVPQKAINKAYQFFGLNAP